MNADPSFLVAEDSENDILLLRHAFTKAGLTVPLAFVRDGQEAIDSLMNCQAAGSFPRLLLLDLQMPKYNGFEVLQWIRGQAGLRRLIVVILTTSVLPADVSRAYDLGANSYVTKPMTPSDLASLLKALHNYWIEANKCPDCSLP